MSQAVRTTGSRPWLLRHTGPLVVLETAILVAAAYFFTRSGLGLGLALVVVAVTLLFVIPINSGRSLGYLLRLRWGYGQRHPRLDVPADDLQPLAEWLPHFDITATQTGRGDPLGLAFDGDAWVAVLAVVDDDDLIADGPAVEGIDLEALADLTVVDDIVFDGVQLITHVVGAPAVLVLGERAPAVAAYRELGNPTPPAVRSTWIAVRLDPRRCLPAVTRRGPTNHVDGAEGPLAALRFGVHRVQSQLKLRGVTTRLVGADEMRDVMIRTSSGAPASREMDGEPSSDEEWDSWSVDGFIHAGRAIRSWGENPSMGYQQLLQLVGQAPVLWGMASYTVSPDGPATGALRLVGPDEDATIDALDDVSHHVGAAGVDVEPFSGIAVPSLLATVPLGRGWPQ